VSGADGSLLYEVTGEPGELFGRAVTGLGDADADGFDDFAVGAPRAASAKGYAKVCSGQTGASVAQINGDCMYSTFGWQLDGLGDVNGDGLPELAISQSSYDIKAACPGVIRVFDPTVGVLHAFPTEDPQFGLPSEVAGIGDVDGDALTDLLIVFPGSLPAPPPAPATSRHARGSQALSW
jgi:hypothetical protein